MTPYDRWKTREQEEVKPVFYCDLCHAPIYPGEKYVLEDGFRKCTDCVEILEASEDDYEEV